MWAISHETCLCMSIWSLRNNGKDYDVSMSQRRHKKAIVEIFSTKPKFVAGCLKRWFVKKIKVVYVEIDFQTKKLY